MPDDPAPSTPRLDAWIPRWQFEECHSIEINGTEEAIQSAIRSVTPGEIPLVRLLTRIRQPFERRTSGKPVKSIVERAQRERFVVLDDTPWELVMGLAGRFWTPSAERISLGSSQQFVEFETPGFAKAAINFRVEPVGPSRFRVTTETRVRTFGRAATVKFGLYWWLAVRWGSGWIRMLWLRAIRRRVERAASS